MDIRVLEMDETRLELLNLTGHVHLEIHQQQVLELKSEEMVELMFQQQVIETMGTPIIMMDDLQPEVQKVDILVHWVTALQQVCEQILEMME